MRKEKKNGANTHFFYEKIERNDRREKSTPAPFMSIDDSIRNAKCILCRQKGYGCKCGGAAGEMTREAAEVYWSHVRPSPKEPREEKQMCDWCKGKGVPSHRPYNCRDRANRASRFYEAPSVEQEREDQKMKQAKKEPFLFGGGMFGAPPKMELDFVNGFMGSHEQRAPSKPFTWESFQAGAGAPQMKPFTFQVEKPYVSAFPPGGCPPISFAFKQ